MPRTKRLADSEEVDQNATAHPVRRGRPGIVFFGQVVEDIRRFGRRGSLCWQQASILIPDERGVHLTLSSEVACRLEYPGEIDNVSSRVEGRLPVEDVNQLFLRLRRIA